MMKVHHYITLHWKYTWKKNVAIWIPSIIFVIASLYTGLVILVVCCGSERQLLDLIQVCRFPAIHCADHNRPCEGGKDDFGIVDNTCIILYPVSIWISNFVNDISLFFFVFLLCLIASNDIVTIGKKRTWEWVYNWVQDDDPRVRKSFLLGISVEKKR